MCTLGGAAGWLHDIHRAAAGQCKQDCWLSAWVLQAGGLDLRCFACWFAHLVRCRSRRTAPACLPTLSERRFWQVAKWQQPMPRVGTHRYVFLLFRQPGQEPAQVGRGAEPGLLNFLQASLYKCVGGCNACLLVCPNSKCTTHCRSKGKRAQASCPPPRPSCAAHAAHA